MSRVARRPRARLRGARRWAYVVRRTLWQMLRVLFVLGAALGPGMPPPPPPPRPVAAAEDTRGESLKEE